MQTEAVAFALTCSPGRARGPGANAPSIKGASGPGDFSSVVAQVARGAFPRGPEAFSAYTLFLPLGRPGVVEAAGILFRNVTTNVVITSHDL
jgi:hypothetical protein